MRLCITPQTVRTPSYTRVTRIRTTDDGRCERRPGPGMARPMGRDVPSSSQTATHGTDTGGGPPHHGGATYREGRRMIAGRLIVAGGLVALLAACAPPRSPRR
ncbi:hypothetical protein GCM10010170_095330 [Dactylosporangium salmoneum]|uniref:Uncharacterized protein n=1 Tax=Dactylosporangium salmoneum TaxID=53361 RepID=A0ABP5UPV3_9ACTN